MGRGRGGQRRAQPTLDSRVTSFALPSDALPSGEPVWQLTREEFRRRTRRFFHGTTPTNAARLVREGRPDPKMFGSRTDHGYFGEGFYTTVEPSDAYGRNVLVVEVRPDARILEWHAQRAPGGSLAPASAPPWLPDLLARLDQLSIAHRGRPHSDSERAPLIPGNPGFSHVEFVREAYAYARARGYAVYQRCFGETVILDPDSVTRIYRAGRSFAEAVERYSHEAAVRRAIEAGELVRPEALESYPHLRRASRIAL